MPLYLRCGCDVLATLARLTRTEASFTERSLVFYEAMPPLGGTAAIRLSF